MADIEQEEKETPGKFLDRLREDLRRFTEIDPESEEGEVILKERFLTQSAPDIRHKLLKWAYGPNQSLDTLLKLVQTVYYGREYEEKKEKQKRTKEQAEALAMAMKTVLKQPEKISQRDPGEQDGLAITVESRPRLHVWSVRDHTGRETAPRRVGFRGWTFQDKQD